MKEGANKYLAYGIFDGDMTDDNLNIFTTLEEARDFAVKRMSGNVQEFTEVDGIEGWYDYPETNAFLLEVCQFSKGDWITLEQWNVKLSDDGTSLIDANY